MKKIILFGSSMCGHCQPAKELLLSNNVKFAYLDITESLQNLKRFLKYRDTRDEFVEIKESGKVGIPCLVINDGEKVIFNIEDEVCNLIND